MFDNGIFSMRLRTPNTYFYGYEFGDFAASRAFVRIADYLGNGLCYEVAAMTMLALKDNQSAKIVHGYAMAEGDERSGHAWVEFHENGRSWVASPSWFYDVILRKDIYYGEDMGVLPEPVWTCSYKKFWNQPVSKKLYELTRKPKTSYNILPMLRYYRPDDCDHPGIFGFFNDHERRRLHQYRDWTISGEMNENPTTYRKPISAKIIEEIGVEGRMYPSIEAQIEVYKNFATFKRHHKLL